MVATIRQFVKVEAGGVVRLQSPELREGTVAEVLVLTDPPVQTSPTSGVADPSWLAFIGMGAHSGRTVGQIDAELQQLRDEWDR